MKLKQSKEWYKQAVALEGDSEVGAGSLRREVSLPRTIPRKRWWKCTCHGKLQRYFYPAIVGNQKLCNDGWAKYLWNAGTEKAG